MKTKDCVICGTEFIMYKSTDKCCSYACQSEYNSQKSDSKKKIKQETKSIYVGINDKVVSGELELFNIIWEERDHKSFLSNRPLGVYPGGPLYVNVFAHVLAKGKAKYPKFKLYSKNIILLTPEEHNLLDQGTFAQRDNYAARAGCNWNKVYDLREELIENYMRLFP